jgi:hypothetical protein
MELWLKRTLSGFVPNNDSDTQRRMKKIPLDTVVCVEYSQPRNLKEMRYYWAMCNLVSLNHATLKNKKQVDQALKILSGHADVFTIDGRTVELPRSISFDDCEQDEWQEYLSRAKDAVLQHLLPGVQSSMIEDEIARMVG